MAALPRSDDPSCRGRAGLFGGRAALVGLGGSAAVRLVCASWVIPIFRSLDHAA